MKKTLCLIIALLLFAGIPAFYSAGVTDLWLSIEPQTASLRVEITINVKLDVEIDTESEVLVIFPEQMVLPSEIADGLVTVNDLPVSDAQVDPETSEITFITPAEIDDLLNLTVFFPVSVGIKNPFKGGTYGIEVWIDGNSFERDFEIKSILEDLPIVSVSPDLVGKPVSVSVQIPACPELDVPKGSTLKLIFPEEFALPEFPEMDYLSVNGATPPVISIEENYFQIVIGEDIDTNKPILITISPEFGILSPNWPDTFTLTVEIIDILEETESEPFQLQPLKSTTSISFTPDIPESGWFSEYPEIEFSSTAEREIYYFLGSSAKKLFTEPLSIESEGTMVISFLGRIKNGGWEAPKKVTVNIDTEPPVFPELGDTAFTNQEEYTFTYSVSDTSPVESGIAGVEVEALGSNRFEATVTLSPGKNDFVFYATDSCGREVEVTKTITLDVTPPSLEIFIPERASVLCGRMVNIEGITEPGAKIMVAGNPANVDETGRFWAVTSPAEEGPINIEVTSTDPAGNTTTIIVPIIYISGTSITMKLDSKKAKFAGIETELPIAPYKDFEITYIPLERIAEALDFTLEKDDESEDKWILKDDIEDSEIFFGVGENKLFIHREGSVFEVDLSNSPEKKDDVVCIPLEFVGKVFGKTATEFADGQIIIRFCPR